MTPFAYNVEESSGPWYGRWKNRRTLIIAMGVLLVALFILFSNKGVVRRIMLEQELVAVQSRVTNLQAEIAALKIQRQELVSDSAAIVHVAREQHGMIRPGETVFRIRFQPAESTE